MQRVRELPQDQQNFLAGADMDALFEDGGLGPNKFSELSGNKIIAKTITTEKLTVGSLNFVSSIVWTATDYNTATWAAGALTFSDGKQYSILTGNTGNIASTTYIYLDINVSGNALQITTTLTNAVGEGKTLIAIVQLGASGSGCIIDVIGGSGTTIDGNRITTGKIQSSDTKTYFDLDNDYIIINDGTNDRILIGFQSGGF